MSENIMSENRNSLWSVSGTSIILDPGERETLIEWACPKYNAATLTCYQIGFDDYPGSPSGGYFTLPHSDLDIELAFKQIIPDFRNQQPRYTSHLNPNVYQQHYFSVAVKLIVTNKSNNPITIWGTLKGQHYPVTIIEKEEIMKSDDLANSHDNICAGALPTVGIFKEELPIYANDDIAALHMDNRGRLLVAIDGMTDRAQEQIIELTRLEADINSETTQISFRERRAVSKEAIKKQKVDADYLFRHNELSLKIAKENNHATTAISAFRYGFLSILAKWAAVVSTIITMTYLLT